MSLLVQYLRPNKKINAKTFNTLSPRQKSRLNFWTQLMVPQGETGK